MTQDDMITMWQRHEAAEAKGDLAATMATVGENPRWAFHPFGIVVEGREAVEEFYRRMLPGMEDMVAELVPRALWFNDTGMVVESEFPMIGSDGQIGMAPIIAVLEFKDGLIVAERGYMSGSLANTARPFLGDDFFQVPGVRKIG